MTTSHADQRAPGEVLAAAEARALRMLRDGASTSQVTSTTGLPLDHLRRIATPQAQAAADRRNTPAPPPAQRAQQGALFDTEEATAC